MSGDTRPSLRCQAAGIGVAAAGVAACIAWAVVVAPQDHFNGLSIALGIAAVIAGLGIAKVSSGNRRISAGFLVDMIAATFLGPASAFATSTIGELSSTRVASTRWRALLVNLFANGLPALGVGTAIRYEAPHDHKTIGFYLFLCVLAFGGMVLGWLLLTALFFLMDGDRRDLNFNAWRNLAPTILINVAMAVAGAAIYVELGLPGIIFAFVALIGFSYQARLVTKAQHRSEQYVSLSWGVLAGLLRSLDVRDQRAARHAAAVARFARDIAMSVGMNAEEQELAHTAGLLHDIGHFALSDRVHERGRTLTDEDWLAIHRHPELGADLLRDLGMYGPVAEIVLAHHERIDGRGYPNGLSGEQIPQIAKIISVAEVYDTLTASDTYRTRMSSFEALNELRRVSGSQLEGRYVEALASLLTGEGVQYRHADAADFDSELDMERRIKEASAGA
jgi:putative nucleotidyltransferase with HDIG domain